VYFFLVSASAACWGLSSFDMAAAGLLNTPFLQLLGSTAVSAMPASNASTSEEGGGDGATAGGGDETHVETAEGGGGEATVEDAGVRGDEAKVRVEKVVVEGVENKSCMSSSPSKELWLSMDTASSWRVFWSSTAGRQLGDGGADPTSDALSWSWILFKMTERPENLRGMTRRSRLKSLMFDSMIRTRYAAASKSTSLPARFCLPIHAMTCECHAFIFKLWPPVASRMSPRRCR